MFTSCHYVTNTSFATWQAQFSKKIKAPVYCRLVEFLEHMGHGFQFFWYYFYYIQEKGVQVSKKKLIWGELSF